jgi:cytochrome c oxidase subunit 4
MHADTADAHHDVGTRIYYSIWFWLLALTGVELVLAYIHFTTALLLIMLMGLSIIKAALIIAYFMHLKFERLSLVLTIVPAMVVTMSLLFVFFADSVRLHELRR